jgi:hypothetical protein
VNTGVPGEDFIQGTLQRSNSLGSVNLPQGSLAVLSRRRTGTDRNEIRRTSAPGHQLSADAIAMQRQSVFFHHNPNRGVIVFH